MEPNLPEERIHPSPHSPRGSDPELVPHAYAEGDLIAGKYLLRSPIGEGAMGSVWHAEDILAGVSVALKLLRQEHRVYGEQREYIAERLSREATALTGIRHPAVVRVFDFGTSSWNDPYLALELLDGEPLSSLLARSERLIPEYVVQIMLPIAHGLAAAHDAGVVHRDLKPDNLFLAIDGRIQPKVIDFGLVKLTRGPSNRKLTGAGILGTPDYMAPEQALELSNVDHRADVWAFSVVLYEALSGELPFSEPTFAETLCALVGRDPAPLSALGIDPDLARIVERGLSKKPEARWQSMRELGAALSSWLVSRNVTVDATGTALDTQWQLTTGVPRADRRIGCPEPPKIDEPAPRGGGAPKTAQRSKPKTSAMRTGFRWAIATAVAASALVTCERPRWIQEAVITFFARAEHGPSSADSGVVRDRGAGDRSLQAQSTAP
jgi:eukaryotic-like serine/threonine-protein kinase